MENERNGQAQEGEIVVLANKGLADTTDDIVASAERRVAQLDKVVALSLNRTNAHDWVDQQGKPYLTSSGAEKIARLFGVNWTLQKPEKIQSNDEKGTFYFYTVAGVFTLGRDNIVAVGTTSSKDQFFAKVGGQFKPISEIDETNILKAAISNCLVNGITRLLGIRNLTWEQIDEATKGRLKKEGVAGVKYAGGGAGGGLISLPQQKRLYAILKSAGGTEEALKKKLLEYGAVSATEIKTSDYEKICGWAGDTKNFQKGE